MTTVITRADVEKLKVSWENDPNWDLEYTEGYEDYEEELREFSEKKKAEWRTQAEKAKQGMRQKFNALGLHETMRLEGGVWVLKVTTGWIYAFPQEEDSKYDHVFVPFEI